MNTSSSGSTALPGLYFETLGRFKVYRDGAALGDEIWKRKKALLLISFFITVRSGFTTKEKIFDELWPELDLKRANRDFKVALNAINSALEPGRGARERSNYIQRQGSSYGIRPGAQLTVDADIFESHLMEGSRQESLNKKDASASYRKGLELYRGEYLPDRIYDDWTSSERERLTSLFLLGATRLSSLLVAQGEVVESIDWCKRIIEIDPLWEEAYKLQMQAYMHTGNRPLAIKTYMTCRATLEGELGISPMQETTRLHEQILSS